MLNELFTLFNEAKSKMGFVNVVATVQQIIELFEKEFKEDLNSKNAAIDTVVKLLESYKVAQTTDVAPT